MPKTDVDYSNTIIYKIFCKDDSITDIYVGHTTNFIQRKYSHKIGSNDLKNKLKIYDTIRNNGGWSNWDMIEIAKYNCKDITEARIREHHHYNELKASLNSCPPYVDVNKYYCSLCKIQCGSQKKYETHINCIKHINNKNQSENESICDVVLNDSDLSQKVAEKFCCKFCNYNTCKKSDFNKHLTTDKHKKRENGNDLVPKSSNQYQCECGNIYKHDSGYYRHKKNCNINKIDPIVTKEVTDKELIMMLLKQNAKLIEQNAEMSKNNSNISNNNNKTNSNNKTFNLQFFLNETCKDAINIAEFVSSIKIQLEDLETT
jgi:hypothetical protein